MVTALERNARARAKLAPNAHEHACRDSDGGCGRMWTCQRTLCGWPDVVTVRLCGKCSHAPSTGKYPPIIEGHKSAATLVAQRRPTNG